jgi:hypothetical protein
VEDNSDKLTGKYYLEPTGAASIPKKDEMIAFNHDVATDEYDVLLPPYRGILLEGKASSSSLTININALLVNPGGRNAPKRRTNNNNEIATNMEIIRYPENLMGVYDLLGRKVGENLNELPEGVYIVMDGAIPRKVIKK